MNDEYDKGYHLGQEHASSPDRKKRPSLLGWKVLTNPVTLLSDPHNNEFQRGYHKGYEDRIRVVNVQPAPSTPISPSQTTSTTSNMSTSYRTQTELQQNLKRSLHKLTEHLDSVSKSYVQEVEQLHAEGMMDETHRDYVQNYLDPTRDRINRLIQHIEAQDIPAIEQEIRRLEERL